MTALIEYLTVLLEYIDWQKLGGSGPCHAQIWPRHCMVYSCKCNTKSFKGGRGFLKPYKRHLINRMRLYTNIFSNCLHTWISVRGILILLFTWRSSSSRWEVFLRKTSCKRSFYCYVSVLRRCTFARVNTLSILLQVRNSLSKPTSLNSFKSCPKRCFVH